MLNKIQLSKKIIFAGFEPNSEAGLQTVLENLGFTNLVCATECSEIYRIIRGCIESPEELGLVFVDANLPGGQVYEMCQSLSGEQDGIFLPFILVNQNDNPALGLVNGNLIYKANYHQLAKGSDILMIVEFMLALKYERKTKYEQQEELSQELATRKLLDAKLNYLVAHDELTGLMNRGNLEMHIRASFNRKEKSCGALLLIDLDRFGLINDLEGFDGADQLILDVVGLIRKSIDREARFARIHSDEFCLFFDDMTSTQARIIAEDIRQSLNDHRFDVGDVCYTITASIGVAELGINHVFQHPEELIARAHQACSLAKLNGRNMVWFFNENDNAIQERHRDVFWVPLIREALLNHSFFLMFQPVVNLRNGDVSHYEVLIRMKGQEQKVISPAEFIPVAERMGLIHSIDLWVVENAIDFLAALPSKIAHISLSINLSGMAFQDALLLPTIKKKLQMSWVKAERITFEITETAAIDNFEQTRNMITQIRALGCRFALDDFGAGFCSFNYLKKFPVDYVKIDGQFIQNLCNDDTDQVLVKSMSEIARRLGKKTIAEFIESPKVIKILIDMGIDYGQGYIFGKPSLHLNKLGYISLQEMLIQGENNPRFLYN